MEVLKKYIGFVLICLSCAAFGNEPEDKGFVSIIKAIENPQSTNFIALDADSNSLQLFKENIQSLKHIRGIAVFGRLAVPENLWKALSEIQLLEYLFFIDNELESIEIGGTSSTLKYLWIQNSPLIDVQSLNAFLNRSNLITSLRLENVKLNQVPSALKSMPILKELQISNSAITFKELLKVIGKNEKLEKLLITDNNFQFTSKGLKKINQLKYLDLSGNQLSEEVVQLKYLENIDTLVLNRNAFDELNTTAQSIQKIRADVVVFDDNKEDVKNNIEYLLPGKEVIWSKQSVFTPHIELPSFKMTEKSLQDTILETRAQKSGIKVFNSSSAIKILSEAYLEYDRLVFPDPLKELDTTRFVQRYLDSSYVFVEKIEIQNHTQNEEKHKLKFKRKYGGVKKKKKTVKIDHYKDSHIVFHPYTDKPCDDGFVLIMSVNDIEGHKRSDLKSFQQYLWLVNLDEESFSRQFIQQKAWSDVRIEFENGVFLIKLKGRFIDDELIAELRYKRDPNDVRRIERDSERAFTSYSKKIKKEEIKFNKSVKKEENLAIRPYKRDLTALWAKVEVKMSEEEKNMTREEWLKYYHDLKEVEYNILPNTELELAYLAKYMVSQGFIEKRSNDFYVGQRWVEAILLNQKDTVQVKQFCLVNLDQKIVSKVDVKENQILLEPFHDLIIYGKTDTGKFFSLTKGQINDLLKREVVYIGESQWINTLPTTAVFYKQNVYPQLPD